jgi:hypothetical protein
MRIRLIAGLGLGALATIATACSSSSSGSNNPYPDVSHFCAAVAKAECQEATNCGVDASMCETYRASQCNSGVIVLKLTPSDTLSRQYSSDKAQGCINALNSAFGGGQNSVEIKYDDLFKSGGIIDTCEAVFAGNVGNGSACTTNYDCTQSGEVCASVPGQQAACATPTMKAQGSACADPGDTCAAGNYCSNASGSPKCVASGTTGGPCMANDQCVATDHCVGGACAALSISGEPCTSNADCDPTAPFCDPDVDKCAVALGFLNGSFDCNGFLLGQGLPDGGGPVVNDGGNGNDGGTMEAATGDAPSGG